MLHYSKMIDYLETLDEITLVKNNKKVEFYNIECGFDIETTS